MKTFIIGLKGHKEQNDCGGMEVKSEKLCGG